MVCVCVRAHLGIILSVSGWSVYSTSIQLCVPNACVSARAMPFGINFLQMYFELFFIFAFIAF